MGKADLHGLHIVNFPGATKHFLTGVLAKMESGLHLKQARQSVFHNHAVKQEADIALYAAVERLDPLSRKPENTYAKVHPRWEDYTQEETLEIVRGAIKYCDEQRTQ